ncbi:MAG: sensor histidine kinase [Candidatus Nitrosotenuis sp.]
MNNSTIVNVLGIVVLIVGSLVILGWVFSIDILKSILPGGPTMKFGTSLSFVCTGIALLFITRMRKGRITLAQIGLPALAMIIIMFLTVNTVSVLLGSDISLVMLFMKQQSPANTTPSIPSVGALVNFTLIVAIMYLLSADFARIQKTLISIGIIIGIIGGIPLVGYIFNLPFLYYNFENISNAMAVHTSVLFLFTSAALILIGKDKENPTRLESAQIKTRMVALFVTVSSIPVLFLGIMTYLFIRDLDVHSSFEYSFAMLGGIGISTAVLFAYFFTRQVVRPIADLRDTIHEISKGKLDIKAREDANDEIGELARSFNVMVEDLKTITSLKIETEKLKQIDKDKEEFAAMVSHELKTPIIPISGYAELFLDGTLGNMTETQKEKMHIIYENSIRLSSLIQDILDARKIELGRLKLDVQDVTIKEIVKRSLDIFKPIVEQRGTLLVDKTDDIVVRCDSDRILQVLSNIISNAVKFVPEQHGTISINSRIENGMVVVGVQDNGIGIPKTKQEDLFKKFYQVDKSLTRKSGGTGLGLAISRGIIESHGGKIWVESKENEGTTVYFTVPKGDGT